VTNNDPPRRRRRVRGPETTPAPAPAPLPSSSPSPSSSPWPSSASPSPSPSPEAVTSPVYDEAALPALALAPVPVSLPGDGETSASERGLRGLVGPGSSQVSPAAALRARDAARPRPEDLAKAESELTIIRRNWSPRD
jgi:hypothetical protein